jgi:hypothetical protein
MASASTAIPPTRRVALQDISVNGINKALAGNALLPVHHKATGARTPAEVAAISCPEPSGEGRGQLRDDPQVGRLKRGGELREGRRESEIKRFKGEGGVETDGVVGQSVAVMAEVAECHVDADGDVQSEAHGVSSIFLSDVAMERKAMSACS